MEVLLRHSHFKNRLVCAFPQDRGADTNTMKTHGPNFQSNRLFFFLFIRIKGWSTGYQGQVTPPSLRLRCTWRPSLYYCPGAASSHSLCCLSSHHLYFWRGLLSLLPHFLPQTPYLYLMELDMVSIEDTLSGRLSNIGLKELPICGWTLFVFISDMTCSRIGLGDHWDHLNPSDVSVLLDTLQFLLTERVCVCV